MSHLLDNPVFNALCSGDAHLGSGTENVKFFDEEVSPFAGCREGHANGFDELYQLLPPRRKILYATRGAIEPPGGWLLANGIRGLQFIYTSNAPIYTNDNRAVALTRDHVEEMMALAALTRPGPFNLRTIEFGRYFGVFENGRLAAMTGQRLHPGSFTEISAVCTHPDFLGKGFAASLVQLQLELILRENRIPFLHVREDNSRAIALYQRLGFTQNGPMNFYFLRRGA